MALARCFRQDRVTATVYAETLARARAGGRRISALPSWFNVDRVRDLARLGRAPQRGTHHPRRTLAVLAGLAL